MASRWDAGCDTTAETKKNVQKMVAASARAPVRENLRLFKIVPLPFGRVCGGYDLNKL
jgi:hypothetical protein